MNQSGGQVSRWWFKTFGQEMGPLSTDELVDLARRGILSRTDCVRRDSESWQVAESVVELGAAWSRDLSRADPTPATATADSSREGNPVVIKKGWDTSESTAASRATGALERMFKAATHDRKLNALRQKQAVELTYPRAEATGERSPQIDMGPPLDIDEILSEFRRTPNGLNGSNLVQKSLATQAIRGSHHDTRSLKLLEFVVFASGGLLALQLLPDASWWIVAMVDVRGWSWKSFAIWSLVVVVLLIAIRNAHNKS